MTSTRQRRALECAVCAAQAAGKLMRENLRSPKKINSATQHDIKLELDVRCQKRIEKILRAAFPDVAVLGEEGTLGDPQAGYRWVVDPIDGTVNFAYGIPHAAVSIALQVRRRASGSEFRIASSNAQLTARNPEYDTILGVVYDPFGNELWTALRGETARLNGKVIHASTRRKLNEAIISIGFAKESLTLDKMLPTLNELIRHVRKIRIMGSAALALVYVASGRVDAYLEYGLRLWDIAAGGLIIECADGEFWHRPVEGEYTYRIMANNGLLRRELEKFAY
jgi:myo-inositol-1(or 4)-monophosphatase